MDKELKAKSSFELGKPPNTVVKKLINKTFSAYLKVHLAAIMSSSASDNNEILVE